MTPEERTKLEIISAYMGNPLTEEQMEFASDFTKDTMSFSDPGTGKTHTLTAGLVMAQRVHKVPGNAINCMSFTNAAVSEVAGRYASLCTAMSIQPTVKFNTLHSLTKTILKDAYMGGMQVVDADTKQDVEDLTIYMQQLGYDVSEDDYSYVRKVLRAINSMNTSLVFHEANVSSKFEFVELKMDIEDFQNLRISMFTRGLVSKRINVGDIPLYCLYALMKREEVAKRWRGKYQIMVIDEFQDMSLLHLQILSYIAKTLIVIGDIKQQIYEFNGACPHIVPAYMQMHPNARICNLTQSFRCPQTISDFATRIIQPNDRSIVPFTGHQREGDVYVSHRRDLNWKDLIGELAEQRRVNGYGGMRNTMFLYRNNASAIPVIEELYKHEIPYRCSKFAKVMDVPIFETLSKLVNAAWQPDNYDYCEAALRVFPEFRKASKFQDTPVVQAMKASGKTLFEVAYKYKEQSSYDILTAMVQARRAIEANKTAGIVYMKLMEVYKKHLLKLEWWKVDNSEDFYFGLVGPICNSKTYPQMYNEELEKESKNTEAIKANFGVRCYTIHSSKGLEADDVYILDCDEGTFPNASVLKKKIDAGCFKDVAVNIRSERNLLYVAITRAKRNVTISYSGTELAKLVGSPEAEACLKYDSYYNKDVLEYNDAEEFFKLFRIGEYANG